MADLSALMLVAVLALWGEMTLSGEELVDTATRRTLSVVVHWVK
jgi:hypothetical protein